MCIKVYNEFINDPPQRNRLPIEQSQRLELDNVRWKKSSFLFEKLSK